MDRHKSTVTFKYRTRGTKRPFWNSK